jgi:hypothetical protein
MRRMQTDRRSVLKAGGLLAGLGTTGLAGCSGILGGGSDPGPADYRYDPSVLAETENKFFGVVDYAALYEARENFPESTRESFESADDSPVPPEEIDSFTGVGGAQITMGEGSSATAFGSVALLGSFGADAATTGLEDDGAEQIGEYAGFTLYENAGESSPDSIAGGDTRAVAAVSDGVAIFGAGGSSEEAATAVTGRQTVETMIDAGNGEVDRLEPNSERAQQLAERIGESNVVVGGQVDPALVETAMQQSQNGMQAQFVDGFRAGGFGMTVDGATTTMNLVLLYTDAGRAENSGVQELVDLAAQQAVENNPGLDSVEAEYDGSAAVVTVEGETETIFREGASSVPGGGFAIAEPAAATVSRVTEP